MSKPDEITLWAAVDGKRHNNTKWVFGLEPTWDKAMKFYRPDDKEVFCRDIDDNNKIYVTFFANLEPGQKRPVTLTVKLGKAVKG